MSFLAHSLIAEGTGYNGASLVHGTVAFGALLASLIALSPSARMGSADFRYGVWAPASTRVKNMLAAVGPYHVATLAEEPAVLVHADLRTRDAGTAGLTSEYLAFDQLSGPAQATLRVGQGLKALIIAAPSATATVPMAYVMYGLGWQGVTPGTARPDASSTMTSMGTQLVTPAEPTTVQGFCGLGNVISIEKMRADRYGVHAFPCLQRPGERGLAGSPMTRDMLSASSLHADVPGPTDASYMTFDRVSTRLAGGLSVASSQFELLLTLGNMDANHGIQTFVAETHEARAVQKVEGATESKTALRACTLFGAYSLGWYAAEIQAAAALFEEPGSPMHAYVRHNYPTLLMEGGRFKTDMKLIKGMPIPAMARQWLALNRGRVDVTSNEGLAASSVVPDVLWPAASHNTTRETYWQSLATMMIGYSSEEGWLLRAARYLHSVMETTDMGVAYMKAAGLWGWRAPDGDGNKGPLSGISMIAPRVGFLTMTGGVGHTHLTDIVAMPVTASSALIKSKAVQTFGIGRKGGHNGQKDGTTDVSRWREHSLQLPSDMSGYATGGHAATTTTVKEYAVKQSGGFYDTGDDPTKVDSGDNYLPVASAVLSVVVPLQGATLNWGITSASPTRALWTHDQAGVSQMAVRHFLLPNDAGVMTQHHLALGDYANVTPFTPWEAFVYEIGSEAAAARYSPDELRSLMVDNCDLSPEDVRRYKLLFDGIAEFVRKNNELSAAVKKLARPAGKEKEGSEGGNDDKDDKYLLSPSLIHAHVSGESAFLSAGVIVTHPASLGYRFVAIQDPTRLRTLRWMEPTVRGMIDNINPWDTELTFGSNRYELTLIATAFLQATGATAVLTTADTELSQYSLAGAIGAFEVDLNPETAIKQNAITAPQGKVGRPGGAPTVTTPDAVHSKPSEAAPKAE